MEFVPFRGDLLCIPLACQTLEEARDVVSVPNLRLYYGLRFFRKFPFLLKLIFFHLKRRGILPIVWVLNKYEEFDRAVSLGAAGMMTDYPESAVKYYRSKGVQLT